MLYLAGQRLLLQGEMTVNINFYVNLFMHTKHSSRLKWEAGRYMGIVVRKGMCLG